MTMIAYAFLQAQQFAGAKGGQTRRRTTASTQPPSRQAGHAADSVQLDEPPMSAL
jgi:hypothetical protein